MWTSIHTIPGWKFMPKPSTREAIGQPFCRPVTNLFLYFQDRHTTAHAPPVVDKKQDWFLLHGEENDFGTILKFVRKLDTCDNEDKRIDVRTWVSVVWCTKGVKSTDIGPPIKIVGGPIKNTGVPIIL